MSGTNSWSEAEVEAAVRDYFDMLRLELTGEKYNKAEHARGLLQRLRNRSKQAVEFKHANISAVLIEMGIPYIDGYKPRYNYQRSLLPEAVTDYLRSHPELQVLFQKNSEQVPEAPSVQSFLDLLEAPPTIKQESVNRQAEPRPIYNPMGVNYLEREARNHLMGEAGEQFVIDFEKARLIHAGRESLADRVEQISATQGPAAGFDILSFELSGAERFIEAKTTKYGKSTPFFVTPNELDFSRRNQSQYQLYRVFRFGTQARLFTLQGHLEEHCRLQPSEYVARPI